MFEQQLTECLLSEPMYRQMYQTSGAYQQQYGKNVQYPLVGHNSYGYVPASSIQQQQQLFYNANMGQYGAQRAPKSQMVQGQNVGQKSTRGGSAGYQLKVGGVVVGSWANGTRNAQGQRMNRAGMVRNMLRRWYLF